MNLSFGMTFLGEEGNSVNIRFHCVDDIDLVVKRVQYFYADKKWDDENPIYAIKMKAGEEKTIPFRYPDRPSGSYRSISCVIEDRINHNEFHVNVKYDDSVPYIRLINNEDSVNGQTNS